MHLMVWSILAIANLNCWKYVNSYKTGIVAYTPALNKFPVQNTYIQGYARYVGDNGVQPLIAYTYPKPFYQVSQPITYVKSAFAGGTPILQTIGSIAVPNQQNKASDLLAARESHFFTWAHQQYQALKADIDILRNAGKQPSANMIEKLLPLEKIATTTNFASIREHPDVRLIREEHLRLWNEAASKTLHADAESIRSVNTPSSINIKSLAGLLEQKLPYGSHLLLQNPQITDIKQLGANRLLGLNQTPLPKILYLGVGQNISQQQGVVGVQVQHNLWNTKSDTAAHSNQKQSEGHSPDIHHRVHSNSDSYTQNIREEDTAKPPQEVQAGSEYIQHNISGNQLGVKTPFNVVQSLGQQILYGTPLYTNYYTNSSSKIHNDGKSTVSNIPLFGNKMFQGVLSNTQYHPSGVIDNYNHLKSIVIGGQSTDQEVVRGLHTNTPYTLNAASKAPHNAESAFSGSHSVVQHAVKDLKSGSIYGADVVQNYHDDKSDFNRGQSLGEQAVVQTADNYGTKLVHLEIPLPYQELLQQHTFVNHPKSFVSVPVGEHATQQQVGEQNTVAHAYDTQSMYDGLLKLHGVQRIQPHVLEQKHYAIEPEPSVQHSSGVQQSISTLPSIAYNTLGVIGNNRKILDILDPSNSQHLISHQVYNANSNLHPKNNPKNLSENQGDPIIYIPKSEELLEQFVNEHNTGQQIKKSYLNVTPGKYRGIVEGQQTVGYQNTPQQPAEHRLYGVQFGLTQDGHGDAAKPVFSTERTVEQSIQDAHADYPTVHNLAVEVHNGVKSYLDDGQSTVQQGVTSQVDSLPESSLYNQHNKHFFPLKEQGHETGQQQQIYDIHSTISPEHSNTAESQYDAKLIEETYDVTQHEIGRPSISDELPARQEFVDLQTSGVENSAVNFRNHEGSSDPLHKVYFHSPSTALKENFQYHQNIGRHSPNIHANSYINAAGENPYGVISPLSEGQSVKHHAVDPQTPSAVFDNSTPLILNNQQLKRYQEQAHIGVPLSGQQHRNPAEVQGDVSYGHDVLLDNPYGVKSFHDRNHPSVSIYNTQQTDGNPIGTKVQQFPPKQSNENKEQLTSDTPDVINQVKSVLRNHSSIAGIVPPAQHSLHIEDTPEVIRAREEHIRIFNQIKANAVQHAQSKAIVLGPADDVALHVVDKKQFENTHEAREQFQEKLNLQRQRIQEAERLQKEQEQLQFEREREAQRLAEEKRRMEAELIYLKEEEKKRAALDKLLEATQLQKQFSPSNDYKKNSDETGTQESEITSNLEYYNHDKSNAKANNKMLDQSATQFKHSSNTDQKQQYLNTPNVAANEMVKNFQPFHSIDKSKPTSEYQSAVQSEIDNDYVHNGSASNTFQEIQKAEHSHLPSHEGATEQLRSENNSTITSKDC